MRTDNMNEQGPGETKLTRNGVASDDKSKEPDFSGGHEAPAAETESKTVRQKSGVATDDKSKSFGA